MAEETVLLEIVEKLGKHTAQNEEIIRRLAIQNGRVDKLESMQWKIIVYMALAVAGAQGTIEALQLLFT